tara:strand:- start:46 stop:486 length:441 start_codon:yes stop_codon:yes gene_type:complete
MKAKTFENLIRKIVREEIDYALRREIKSLKEDLHNDLKPTIVEHTEKRVETPQQSSLKEEIMGLPKTKKQKKIDFGVGGTLNDLLNETAQGDTNLDNGTSPVSIDGEFSTIGGMPAEAAPKVVQEAVNRDYSSLMNAINKKKKNRP